MGLLAGVEAMDQWAWGGEMDHAQQRLRFLLEGRHLGYPVVEDGRPVGLISLHGVRKIPRSEWSARTIGAAMVPLTDRRTAAPDENMDRVLEKLAGAPTGRLLVLDDGAIAGIVTRSDLARWLERARLLECD